MILVWRELNECRNCHGREGDHIGTQYGKKCPYMKLKKYGMLREGGFTNLYFVPVRVATEESVLATFREKNGFRVIETLDFKKVKLKVMSQAGRSYESGRIEIATVALRPYVGKLVRVKVEVVRGLEKEGEKG